MLPNDTYTGIISKDPFTSPRNSWGTTSALAS
jgi:hypothetical protein